LTNLPSADRVAPDLGGDAEVVRLVLRGEHQLAVHCLDCHPGEEVLDLADLRARLLAVQDGDGGGRQVHALGPHAVEGGQLVGRQELDPGPHLAGLRPGRAEVAGQTQLLQAGVGHRDHDQLDLELGVLHPPLLVQVLLDGLVDGRRRVHDQGHADRIVLD